MDRQDIRLMDRQIIENIINEHFIIEKSRIIYGFNNITIELEELTQIKKIFSNPSYRIINGISSPEFNKRVVELINQTIERITNDYENTINYRITSTQQTNN